MKTGSTEFGKASFVLLFEPFLHTEFYHLPEQIPGHWLTVWQMQGAFGMGQLAETVRKSIDGRLSRVEAHVLLFCREMDQIPLQNKSWDSPGDFLAYFWVTAVDQRPERSHPLLQLPTVGRNVFVNGLHRTSHRNPSLSFSILPQVLVRGKML